MTGNPNRRSLAAYAAGITVIAGLMAVVTLGGSAVMTKKAAMEIAAPQMTALNE